MSDTYDVAIFRGGIVGAACAPVAAPHCDYRTCGTAWVTADEVALNVTRERCKGVVRQDRNAQMLIGPSRQYGSTDPQAEPGMIDRMLSQVIDYMTALPQPQQLEEIPRRDEGWIRLIADRILGRGSQIDARARLARRDFKRQKSVTMQNDSLAGVIPAMTTFRAWEWHRVECALRDWN